jgi:lysyl-tRNA synthetase class 2
MATPAIQQAAVALRLAPTRASAVRLQRAVAVGVAAAVALFGALQVIVVSNGALGTLAGAALIGLAPALAKGRRRAHWVAIVLVLASSLAAVAARDGNWGEITLLALALAVVLAVSTPAFRAVGDPASRTTLTAAVALGALAALADLAHAGGVFSHPLVLTAGLAAVVLAVRAAGPWGAGRASAPDEWRRAAQVVARDGRDTLAPFALRRDKRYFFDERGTSFLAYRTVAGVALVSGDPVGEEDAFPDLLAAFERYAARRGWAVAALGVSGERLPLWRELGFHAHYTGDEAVVDPTTFSLEGRAIRKVRQSVTRLERAGFRVEVRRTRDVDDALAARLADIADHWRQGRSETGFSMAYESARVDRERDDVYAIALDGDGRAQGFLHLAALPAGRALSLSSMRRDRSTPNGLNEFLICRTLTWAAEHGIERVSLNFAAFAAVLDPPGPVDRVTRLERRALGVVSGRFQLERLLAFSEKFAPGWIPRYVAYPSRRALPRIGLAAMLAEAYLVLPRRGASR